MLNIKILRILNFVFILFIIFEILFLVVYPTVWTSLLWFTLPFVFLTGLLAVFYKTILHAIAFLIVNFVPITIALCNIFDFDYFNGKYFKNYTNVNYNFYDKMFTQFSLK
jgi:hypothetical protein